MSQLSTHNTTELDLGQHTLILNQDGSMELLTNDEQSVSHGVSLASEETYRLLVSLQAQWQPTLLAEQQEARAWDW